MEHITTTIAENKQTMGFEKTKQRKRSSYKEHREDALAPSAEEGRGRLR